MTACKVEDVTCQSLSKYMHIAVPAMQRGGWQISLAGDRLFHDFLNERADSLCSCLVVKAALLYSPPRGAHHLLCFNLF